MNGRHIGKIFILNARWMVCALGIILAVRAQATETVLHTFSELAPNGRLPNGALIGDAQGNLYGTTLEGGQFNYGIVYKIDSTGKETVLYNFTDGSDGAYPNGGLVLDAAGNLYGTAEQGGTTSEQFSEGAGVVFELTSTGTYTVLYSFTGGTDGARPYSGVTLGADGYIYGTTAYGGNIVVCPGYVDLITQGCGVVYKLDTAGNETVLLSFTAGVGGAYPYATLALDAAGNLYGTTSAGGDTYTCPPYELQPGGCGVLFSLNPIGQETLLYTFPGGPGSASGVVIDATGNIYGTANGAIYEISEAGQYSVVYAYPFLEGVIRDAAGNLYGTAGQNYNGGYGEVYKLDTAGTFTVLYSFSMGLDGYAPLPGLLRDAAGNLYGTTQSGGADGLGVIFRVSAAGQETVIRNFTVSPGGANPMSPLIRDAAGNLYGTNSEGGATPTGNGFGVLYELNTSGLKVLHSFAGGDDGESPQGHLARDVAGNIYGTTQKGGQPNHGVLYKVDSSGNETILHTFTGHADGSNPIGGVILDPSDNLYGTTSTGAAFESGVIFKVTPGGEYSVLYTFTGQTDGSSPSSLTMDAAGNLYGTAARGAASSGVVFELSAAGQFTALYTFTAAADGVYPVDGVVLDAAGNLYGATTRGGVGYGVAYKVDTSGHETVLHTFTGGADGSFPKAGLIRDAAGNLYGTTSDGGTGCPGNPEYYYGCGVVYKLIPNATESVLYNFTAGADGADPSTALTPGAPGILYGTTFGGGVNNFGVVYEITNAPAH